LGGEVRVFGRGSEGFWRGGEGIWRGIEFLGLEVKVFER
jgi:hypothetical protein